MTKTLGVSSAVALLLALSLPGPTNALETKQREGLTKATPQATEISAQRRRVVRRYYRYPRRYYRPSYAYRPYPYYIGHILIIGHTMDQASILGRRGLRSDLVGNAM